MGIWELVLMAVLTIGAALLAFVFRKPADRHLKTVLSFSGAYLLGVTIVHMLPELYQINTTTTAFIVIGGFFFQLLLDLLSKGIEHGHLHISGSGSFFPWSVFIGLALHAFFEGLPLGWGHDHHHALGGALYFGILFHKIPASFVLLSVLLNNKITRSRILPIVLIFSLMTPLGALTSEYILPHIEGFESGAFYNSILAFITGIFLHISTTILFEAAEKHQYSWPKLVSILIGFGMALLTLHL